MDSSPSVPKDALKSKSDRGVEGEIAVRAVTIGKPRDEVYGFFRRFSNLGRFMENIERVDELDATRSHWVVKAPAGQTVFPLHFHLLPRHEGVPLRAHGGGPMAAAATLEPLAERIRAELA